MATAFVNRSTNAWIDRTTNAWQPAEFFTPTYISVLESLYGDFYRSSLESVYGLVVHLRTMLESVYGLEMVSLLVSRYGDAPLLRSQLVQWYGDAPVLRSKLISRYDDALMFRVKLESVYALAVPHRSALESLYSLMAERLLSQLDSSWDIKNVNPYISKLVSPWSILDDESLTVPVAVSVTIGGIAIDPEYIGYERARDQYKINAEIHVRQQADVLLATKGAAVVIVAGTETINLVVKTAGRQRAHGNTAWTITAVSSSMVLEDPDGPLLTGTYGGVMASVLVNQWAAEVGLSIGWEVEDWLVPVDGVTASDQRPLDLIRGLLDEAEAILQTDLDGSLVVRYFYETSIADLPTATPDISLTDLDDFITTDETTDDRPGYNKYLITDEAAGGPEISLVQVECSGDIFIRAFIVPWGSYQAVQLVSSHDGVVIEPRGTQLETVSQDDVEFVGGSASVDNPVYGAVSVDYQTDNLGVVTGDEDGVLTAATPGESLADVSYQTRYFEWRVEVPDTAQLILMVE